MNELIQYFVGDVGAIRFLAMMVFALVGATIQLTREVAVRRTDGNPRKLSARYLMADNWKRMVNTFLLIYVVLRFPFAFVSSDLLEALGVEWMFVLSVAVGYSVDSISRIIKKRFNIFSNADRTQNS